MRVQNALFIFFSLFRSHVLLISNSIFRCLGLPDRCFRMEGLAKIEFSWKSVLKNFGIDLFVFFPCCWSCFSDFLGLGNKFENETVFSKKPDLEKWIWLGRSRGIRAL